MTFNNDTKEKLNKMAKHCGISGTYYDDYIVMFDKVNIYPITQHMLIFSKKGDNQTVLHYGEYYEDDNLCFVGMIYKVKNIQQPKISIFYQIIPLNMPNQEQRI